MRPEEQHEYEKPYSHQENEDPIGAGLSGCVMIIIPLIIFWLTNC